MPRGLRARSRALRLSLVALALVFSTFVAPPADAACPYIGRIVEVATGWKTSTLGRKYRVSLREPLGAGGQGQAFVGTAPVDVILSNGRTLKAGSPVVVKVALKKESAESLRNEAEKLARLDGAAFPGAAFDPTEQVLVTEYVPGSFTLDALLKYGAAERMGIRIDRAFAEDLIAQLRAAQREMAAKGVVHGDLYDTNIILIPRGDGGYQVRVIDFGAAAFVGGYPSQGRFRITHRHIASENQIENGPAEVGDDLYAIDELQGLLAGYMRDTERNK